MIAVAPQEGASPTPSGSESIPLTVAEYFAGIGLFRMGLEAAGWQIVYANDWSEERAQMYEGFFGESYKVKDIFSVDAEDVPQALLATCSFPCIDLSLAGKLRGLNGTHSSAFWGFYEVLKKQGSQSPPIVLLENVRGWLYSNRGEDFYATARALNNLGYACDVFLLDALSFVPQSRPRLFMLGVKDVAGSNDFSLFMSKSRRLMPDRLRELVLQSDDIHWVDLDIPDPPPYKSEGLSETIIETIPRRDSRWWPKHKVQRHLSMMSPSHLSAVESMASGRVEKVRTFFRRSRSGGQRAEVRRDGVAGCLRTVVGGSGKQFLVVAGNDSIRMRALTVREYARLQGVPDTFPIVANTEQQAYNAFGDAVCMPVIFWLAKEILIPLANRISHTSSTIDRNDGR